MLTRLEQAAELSSSTRQVGVKVVAKDSGRNPSSEHHDRRNADRGSRMVEAALRTDIKGGFRKYRCGLSVGWRLDELGSW
jgi:hypothetical protein